MNAIQEAIIFATIKHQNQKRKGTEIPYIVHPMEVMQILSSMNCFEDVIVAGILHDTLEDTDAKPDEIKELFGDNVLAIVQTESEDKSKTWKERKQATIDHLEKASVETKLVCFADKLSNIRSMYRDKQKIGADLWKRFNASKEDIEWYYREILRVIRLDEFRYNGHAEGFTFINLTKEFAKTINAVFAE